jgi:hypothetical protein
MENRIRMAAAFLAGIIVWSLLPTTVSAQEKPLRGTPSPIIYEPATDTKPAPATPSPTTPQVTQPAPAPAPVINDGLPWGTIFFWIAVIIGLALLGRWLLNRRRANNDDDDTAGARVNRDPRLPVARPAAAPAPAAADTVRPQPAVEPLVDQTRRVEREPQPAAAPAAPAPRAEEVHPVTEAPAPATPAAVEAVVVREERVETVAAPVAALAERPADVVIEPSTSAPLAANHSDDLDLSGLDEKMATKPVVLIIDKDLEFIESVRSALGDNYEIVAHNSDSDVDRTIKETKGVAIALIGNNLTLSEPISLADGVRETNPNARIVFVQREDDRTPSTESVLRLGARVQLAPKTGAMETRHIREACGITNQTNPQPQPPAPAAGPAAEPGSTSDNNGQEAK